MYNTNLKSIIAPVFTTFLGIGGLLLISPVEINALEIKPESSTAISNSPAIASTSTSPVPEFITTKIYRHNYQNQKAATVYFKGLPLLTFLNSTPTEANQGNSNNQYLLEAQKLALKLDELEQQQADAQNISVSWNNETKSYRIKLQDEELVNFNGQVILPDTTKNLEIDALQATNRLRRLLGNAAPLQEVTGKPQVKKTTPVATVTRLKSSGKGRIYQGVASWYGPGFHGRQTANGERFNQDALTAAHRHLPFGTKVRVTNMRNGRSVIVRVNDRGPFSGGRIIDLSRGAANVIGMVGSGTARVKIEVLR